MRLPGCGGRVVMRVDAMGRLGLAVIRHGAPVEGVRSGKWHRWKRSIFLGTCAET